MKTRAILSFLVAFFACLAVCLAADPNIGTWKLNESKSKIAPGTPKNTTVVYVADGGRIKVIVDGVDKDGKPTHNEWTGMFDGKDYPLVGDPMNDSRGYKTIDANTVELWNKKGGKVMVTGTIVIAPDGKSRTLTTKSKGGDGKEIISIAVYDKQ